VTAERPPRAPVDLRRPRDFGALLGDGFSIYLREFRTFFLIAAAVVIPVNLIVEGIGLGQLTSDYDSSPEVGENVIPIVSAFLLITPLTTAMAIYALLDLSEGRRPRAGQAIQRGLDVFAPVLLVMILYAGAIVLGFFALIIGAVFAFVVFSFCIQAAVIEEHRGADALRRSWRLVMASFWRVLLVTIAVNLIVGALSALVGAPFLSAADSTGSAVYQLVGATLGGVLFTPPAVLVTTLLYFDQRRRADTG
jgi:hypothetical protein